MAPTDDVDNAYFFQSPGTNQANQKEDCSSFPFSVPRFPGPGIPTLKALISMCSRQYVLQIYDFETGLAPLVVGPPKELPKKELGRMLIGSSA